MEKKKLRKLFFLLTVGLFYILPSSVQAQQLSEFATIDSLKVGDTFDYIITLERENEYEEINFPDSSHFSSTYEIRQRQQFKVTSFKDSVVYNLQFFGTVDTLIPQLPVQLVQGQDTTVLYTNPVPVNFHSVLSGQDESFRPLKPIFEFARAWWPYILGLIVLLALGYYGYRYYQKKTADEKEKQQRPSFSPTPFVNPLKEYEKTIKELENAELSDQQDFKKFYIDLGDAIRQYYESLYNLPALESTSRELLQMLKNGSVDDNLIDDTRAVLQEADLVKFAKFNPTTDQANRALEKARDFLQRAREIDGPRIEHLRRKHQTKMEAERQRFEKQHEESEEEVQA